MSLDEESKQDSPVQLRRDSQGVASKLSLALIAIIGAILVAWATSTRVGLSPDSGEYGYAALALVVHGHLASPHGGPLVDFPPGLSLLLAGGRVSGLSLLGADRALDVLSIILLVPSAYYLGLNATDSRWIGVGVAAGATLSTATTAVFTMMWSEPPFIVIMTTVLAVLVRGIRLQRLNTWSIAAIVVGSSAAVGLRYTGVTLLPVVAIGVYAATRKIWWAAVITAGSSVAFVALIAHNLLAGAPALGHQGGNIPPLGVVDASLVALGDLLIYRVASIVGLLIVLAIVIGALSAARSKDLRILLLGTFIVVFWGLLWYGKLRGIVNPNVRLISPAVPAMACVAVYGIARLRPALRMASTLLVGLLLVGSLVHNVRVAHIDPTQTKALVNQQAPTVRAVRTLPGRTLVVSGDASVLALLADRAPILQVPFPIMEATRQEQRAMTRRLITSFDLQNGYLALLSLQYRAAILTQLTNDGISCKQGGATAPLYYCSKSTRAER